MKEKNCKIVQDLLPNYIDKLTNEETNIFIEEHLNTCEECRNMLENMQKEIELKSVKKEDKEINYIKKYNIRLKIFKTLSIMFLLVILIFVISIERKMVILTSLMNSREKIDTSNCYYITEILVHNKCFWTIERYTKDNILVVTSKQYIKEGNSYIEQIDYYKDEDDQFGIQKGGNLERQVFYKGDIYPHTTFSSEFNIESSLLKMYDIWEYFDYTINSKITSTQYEGKDCYLITKDGKETIVEKLTGFVFKITNKKDDVIMYHNYSVGTVTDKDVQRPDTTGYERK